MTSLAEAYERRAGEAGRRRVALGTGLFLAGAALAFGAILVLAGETATPAAAAAARQTAGVLAGLGVPAVFVGVFTVLPAGRAERVAAAAGAGLAVLGVLAFRAVYPDAWLTVGYSPTPAALAVLGVYSLGLITVFWCLFTAVATFKTRNDPGGTVTMEFTQGGETRTVEVAAGSAAEAREAFGSGGAAVVGGVGRTEDTSPSADGGVVSDDVRSIAATEDAEVTGAAAPEPTNPADEYCGNCEHFRYVRTERGIRPYCGFDDTVMDDMDACEEWTPNR
jgi:hypothetical protein